MPQVGDPEDGIVCWMTPEGNLFCEKVLESAECAPMAMFVAVSDPDGKGDEGKTSDRVSGFEFPADWGPNKKELACRIMEVLNASNLPDDTIPRRSGEIVDTVQRLLAPAPPSIMLYNYSTQPADVVGAYYLNKGDLVKMQQLFKTFSNPKKP